MALRRASRAAPLLALLGCTAPAGSAARAPEAPPSVPSPSVPPVSLSASPAPGPTLSPPSCRGNEGLRVEVDGDGRPDVAALHWTSAEPALSVCTGAGAGATLGAGGTGPLLFAYDVDRDGRDELFAGGTTMSGGGVEVVRFRGGRLRFVTAGGGEPLSLLTDYDRITDGTQQEWGCRPERRELVQVTVDWRSRTVRTEAYALRGLTAVRTSATTSAAPAGEPDDEYAGRVAGSCPGRRRDGEGS